MKLRNVLSLLLVALFMITLSQSAFATDVGTNVVGIGDSKEKAITLFGDPELDNYSLYLSSADDKDWFKWTNTTGEDKFVAAYLSPEGNKCAFRLGMLIDYGNARESEFYAKYIGPGNGQSLKNLYIPKGATVYVVVDSTQYYMEQYDLYFRVWDIDL